MPKFMGHIGPYGPMVDVRLWPTRKNPQPVDGIGLIDTGASHTSIDERTADLYQFTELTVPTGALSYGAHGARQQRVFIARLEITFLQGYSQTLQVTVFNGHGTPADNPLTPFIALIGRDILKQGCLNYDGAAGTFSLELP